MRDNTNEQPDTKVLEDTKEVVFQESEDQGQLTKTIVDTDIKELVKTAKDIANPDDKPLISDDRLLDYYDKAIELIKEDRNEARDLYNNFAEMIINAGDGSSSTKEACVNALKISTESTDKMIKILDLWTRMKMKEKNTMPNWLAVQQNNKIENKNFQSSDVRKLIKMAETMEMSDDDKSE